VERSEQLGQELIELASLGGGQFVDELALAPCAGADVFLELGAANFREFKQYASAIVWIAGAPDQATTLELVETVGHGAGRDV
jgi:hypothetical protein